MAWRVAWLVCARCVGVAVRGYMRACCFLEPLSLCSVACVAWRAWHGVEPVVERVKTFIHPQSHRTVDQQYLDFGMLSSEARELMYIICAVRRGLTQDGIETATYGNGWVGSGWDFVRCIFCGCNTPAAWQSVVCLLCFLPLPVEPFVAMSTGCLRDD